MRIRPNSTLANLSHEQLHQLYDWIASGDTLRDVQKRCAQPSPDGFGIVVHLTTLNNFFKTERRRRHAEELAEARFNDLAADDPEQLLQNVRVELAHACYDIAHRPDTASVAALSRMSHRLDLIRLEQQRLALEREFLAEKKRQFNFDAAKQAAIHALEIKEILKDNATELEQKVWKVSEIVFGPPPE